MVAPIWDPPGPGARLTALGKTPPFFNGRIATIVRVNNLILVTLRNGDFEDFPGLQVRSWT